MLNGINSFVVCVAHDFVAFAISIVPKMINIKEKYANKAGLYVQSEVVHFKTDFPNVDFVNFVLSLFTQITEEGFDAEMLSK